MLLAAYANGYFPMALEKDDPELYWFSPEERGVLPLETFNIPRGFKRVMHELPYTVTINRNFEQVIKACAKVTEKRKDTWINSSIIKLYVELHDMGYAHSIEVWDKKELVGGLYGVSLGGAFFGESMFSTKPESSKLALVTLVHVLQHAGYTLLDTQYVNNHLKQFGVIGIGKKAYMTKLEKALKASPNPSTRFSTVSVRKGLASSSKPKRT